jgi:DNA polymerase-3 subunit delta'
MINLPTWLQNEGTALEELIARQRFPHALLIHGPEGTGRRLFAFWLIGRLLGLGDLDLRAAMPAGCFLDPESLPQHPDFQFVQPEPDKRSISIERIRQLIAFLNLKSHQAGPKTALITPAQAMTRPAANSLLKTLEEPPGESCLILVAAAQSSLPPTIVSRCRRVRIPIPTRSVAKAWLRQQAPNEEWGPVLDLAGGAPVGALNLLQSDFPAQAARFSDDISGLLQRKLTPAKVAGRWAKIDPDVYLPWLYRRVSHEIRLASGAVDEDTQQNAVLGGLQNGSESLNIEASFSDLLEINELRRLQGAGLKQELQLTKILGRWYGGVQL